jgi:hypothetical protein
MSSPITLPLDSIINVTVLVSPQAPQAPTFNQGIVVGPSSVIPSSQRVRTYAVSTALAQMLADGFSSTSGEYLAVTAYVSQVPAPSTVQVGRQDLSAIFALNPHSANQGTGYVVNDVVGITQSGASGGTAIVTTISGGGAVTGLQLVNQGTGYAIATSLATTGGTGTGLEVDITQIGETPLQALTACRLASFTWWAAFVTSAVTADHEAIAAYMQAVTPVGCYFYTTQDANVPTNGAGNIFAYLKAQSYSRVYGLYSTTQGGLFPNNIYAGAAAMGVAMGLNTGLDGSFFTMAFKTLVGIATEPLSVTSVQNIQANNGNAYLDYANSYKFDMQGVVANKQYFDEILNIDMLVSDIQFTEANILATLLAVPQTDPGQTTLIHGVNQACERARARGFLAGGNWTGPIVLNLNPGDSVPTGYICQSPSYSTQSTSDRQARKAVPIYCSILEAGAVQSLTIGVYVRR